MNAHGPVVGIDLGTTNSVVAYVNEAGEAQTIAGDEGSRVIPSAVYFPRSGDPIIGQLARERDVIEPGRVAQAFKRGMGERTFLPDGKPFLVDGESWSPEELSALVLKKLRRMAEHHFGREVEKAVITVPAYFGEAEREATVMAGQLAGLEVSRIVNEPTAAAIAHGLDTTGRHGTALVVDLGGGTFDVTVMEVHRDGALEAKATAGDHQLGGLDFDDLILDLFREAARLSAGMTIDDDPVALQEARRDAEKLKIALSKVPEDTRRLVLGGRTVNVTVQREKFEQLLADHLDEIEDHTLYALGVAGVEPEDLDYVLLVGGSTRVPAVQRRLRQITGRQPQLTSNVDEDVARGAALLAAKLHSAVRPGSALALMPPPIDVCSHSLGVTLINRQTMELYNKVVIPAGTALPTRQEQPARTIYHQQSGLDLSLNEGDSRDLDMVRQLGESSGVFRAPVPIDHPVRFVIEYDTQQLIHAKAYDDATDDFLCEVKVRAQTVMPATKMELARRRIAAVDV